MGLLMPPGICSPGPGAPPLPKDVSLVKTDSFASTDTTAMAADAAAEPAANTNNALALRRRFFAPNATLAHADAPLALDRGAGCRLFCAETGRAYLDAQNNVAHLGHGHAGLAAAVGAQLLRLNTNSRYLSAELGLYCRELVETLPPGMRGRGGGGGGGQEGGGEGEGEEGDALAFLTNSGSEANDLALRIAKAHHAQRWFGGGGVGNGGAAAGVDGNSRNPAKTPPPPPPPAFHVAVLAGAYHGHLDSVARLSPYKFWAAPAPAASSGSDESGSGDHQGGGASAAAHEKPSYVHVIPLPDEFVDGRATRLCDGAAAARAVARAARRAGGRIGLVLAESIPSCAGQSLLPPGYLAALFSTLRQEEPGVLCCVDEVQTGFGRIGHPWFWAFEPQLLPYLGENDCNCLPDLLTFGKPAGNGFPLAGLLATRRAARAFCELSGEAYFNTFGGSNCAVAAGRAVLRAVREERLAERAAATGPVLGALLRRVAAAHRAHVSDVRGVGLFWGVEIGRRFFVADEAAAASSAAEKSLLLPAPAKAAWVARRMRDASAVLVSVDGVFGNVLKIKPPMVFGPPEARELAAALDATLWALSGGGGGAVREDELAALERRELCAHASAVAPMRERCEENARALGLML